MPPLSDIALLPFSYPYLSYLPLLPSSLFSSNEKWMFSITIIEPNALLWAMTSTVIRRATWIVEPFFLAVDPICDKCCQVGEEGRKEGSLPPLGEWRDTPWHSILHVKDNQTGMYFVLHCRAYVLLHPFARQLRSLQCRESTKSDIKSESRLGGTEYWAHVAPVHTFK